MLRDVAVAKTQSGNIGLDKWAVERFSSVTRDPKACCQCGGRLTRNIPGAVLKGSEYPKWVLRAPRKFSAIEWS